MIAAERKRERYRANRRYLDAIKTTRGCEFCGEGRLAVLDFHHLWPETKLFNVSGSACNRPRDVLDAEIAKCAVLCANCHRLAEAGLLTLEEDDDEPDDDPQSPPHPGGPPRWRLYHGGT